MNLCQKGIISLVLVAILGLPLLGVLVHLLTESWWFESVGFTEVFWVKLSWQVGIWVVTFIVYFLFLWGNYWIASHRGTVSLRLFDDTDLEIYTKKFTNYGVLVAIFLIALGAASASVPVWEKLLKYFNSTEFSSSDPIFNREIGFYIFRLPLYQELWQWLFSLLIWATILSALVYFLQGSISSRRKPRRISTGSVKTHLTLLSSAIAILIVIHFCLEPYNLLYSTNGAAFGAGYTDVNARIFAYGVMGIVSLIVAVLLFVSARQNHFALPILGGGFWIVVFVLVNGIYPWFVQSFIVEPNELVKEKPYIAHSINFSQRAYRLDEVQKQKYAAQAQLDRQALQRNQPTIQNIRLWDYRPLLSTYRQLQEIRLYYLFKSVDIDRYTFNGNYQQVMLSARELAYSQLPKEAQTWVNQRLKYTHGYGLVMSPVNQITADGLPELYVKDLPPVSTVNLQIDRPAIYYGEETDNYIFTGTKTKEFDYPLGDANALTDYSGQGGVAIPSFWHRLAYAYDRGSLQILISNYFTNRSRIHYYRQIRQRVSHVAPFLKFDRDPYLVVNNGKLQWILDAYTVSDRYPYSQPATRIQTAEAEKIEQLNQKNINYIRNSVKVLIDAYDGTMQFFAIDESDPILRTYSKIFPHLFASSQAISTEIKAHFRYPLDLFDMQVQIYLAYHMSEPEVFYNREDLWQFPKQIYEGNEQVMHPYYAIARLPGEEQAGFILILPFTPSNKDNAIAWMAARSNGKDYGKLLLYEFPKQKLVFGPRQIEARIDQEPSISQQFTLWSQAGSRVIRGDLLVIPIEQSLLYVEPVYLRAEQGELPELKRVIVAYDKKVVMEETLDKCLVAIFGDTEVEKGISSSANQETTNLVKSALSTYQKAEAAARQGNWAEYGRYQQQLKGILQKLDRK
jgi:hypothetical protein